MGCLPPGDRDGRAFHPQRFLHKIIIDDTGATVTAGELPIVRADGTQITHVFQNLISNAVKYQPHGNRPEVRIDAACDAQKWTISVKDNGIGFEPQYAERIFGLFKRMHRDEYSGTRLGLAICRRIIGRHGGEIWAESILGQGATFRFTLPRSTTE